jgi:chromosome segregation ATPase
MSSKPADSNPDAEQDESDSNPAADTPDADPLQIALPDGSESVSDAIVTHREMLREPQDHGLATEQDITHLSEAMESLSADVQETTRQHDESRSRIEDLEDLVETQQRQIDELQSMVTSLAGILGTDTEWQTFDDDA